MTFTGQVKKLADMGGVTEDISVISSKVSEVFLCSNNQHCVGRQVNQQKAKLIDLEANVSLQERSNGKVDLSPSQHPILQWTHISSSLKTLKR